SGYIAIVFNYLLSVAAEDKADEITGKRTGVFPRRYNEGPGYPVCFVFDVFDGRSSPIHTDGLDRVVERTQRYIPDGVFIAGYRGHYDGSTVYNDRFVGGPVHLVPVRVLLFDPKQFDERSPGARPVLPGNHNDVITAFGASAGTAGKQHRQHDDDQ